MTPSTMEANTARSMSEDESAGLLTSCGSEVSVSMGQPPLLELSVARFSVTIQSEQRRGQFARRQNSIDDAAFDGRLGHAKDGAALFILRQDVPACRVQLLPARGAVLCHSAQDHPDRRR